MKKRAQEFDYKGLSSQKLIELCDDKNAFKGFAEWRYWTAEVYSFGKHIRECALYPSILPLHIFTDHGVGHYSDGIAKQELENDAYCQFYHSTESVELFKKNSKKPCYTLLSPFVMCRRKNKIEQLKNAKGTLAFPAHSTPEIDDSSNIEKYIQQLKELPEEFQPVCVCLHMHDLHKEQHKIFIENDIPVYTAGNAFDYRFAERFYDILKHFKYTTSNMVGSYLFYSVEMGIPFSIYGNGPELYNNSDPNLDNGVYNVDENQEYSKIFKMFKGLNKEVTQEQKKIVEENLGIVDGLSRFEMAKTLYTAYLKHGNIAKDLLFAINAYRKFLKRKIKL